MTGARQRAVGHFMAKVLGIQLIESDPYGDEVTRGESVFTNNTDDTFVEQEPTTAEWLMDLGPSGQDVLEYIKSLFPFINWIPFYNLQWFIGDLVAGTFAPCCHKRFLPIFLHHINDRY
jgi:solute carrier family 26 (sodium-independent sulfate anion transporter), member 11